MSALDFAARAKALEARVIAEGVGGTAEAARAAATQAEGKANDAKAAADLVSAALETSRKDINAASVLAKTADEAAGTAAKAAQVAEQLAREAAASAPRLFASLASAALPGSVSRIESTGHAVDGHGAASYVSDGLATAELAKAHPLACFAGEGNRFFRLLPDAQGFITAEQMGCPVYAPGINARPYIQAAIDYCHAMRKNGIKGVAFGQDKYEIWTPLRDLTMNHGTPWLTMAGESIAETDPRYFTGFPLIVRKRIALKACSVGTTFIRRKFDGSDPAVWAGTQARGPHYIYGDGFFWRGGMFYLHGMTHTQYLAMMASEGYSGLAGIDFLGRWNLSGGISQSGFGGQFVDGEKDKGTDGKAYARGRLRPTDGAGWDWSDKPIWFSQLGNTGDLTFEDLEIGGFRGELVYQGGTSGSIVGRRLHTHDTDADGFNPGPARHSDGRLGRIDIDHLIISNCFQAMEGGAGAGNARVGLLEIYDVIKAGELNAGRFNQAPTVEPKPSYTIGKVVLRRAGGFSVQNLTNVTEIVATDTDVQLGASTGNFYGSYIGKICLTHDAKSNAVYFYSNVSSSGGGMTPPGDSYVGEIQHQYSAAGRAAGFALQPSFVWRGDGDFGPNIVVGSVTGTSRSAPTRSGSGPLPRYCPMVLNIATDGAPAGPHNVETTPVIPEVIAWVLRLATSSSSGHFPITLPPVAGKVQKGARMRIMHPTGCIISVQTTNTRMAKRMIMLKDIDYEFVSDGSRWQQVTAGGVLTAESAAALAANADSAPIAVNGARIGMDVRVVPLGDIGGAQVVGRVTGDNTVIIRNTSSVAAPSVTYRVMAEWAS